MKDKIIACEKQFVVHSLAFHHLLCTFVGNLMACITLLSDFGLQDASVAITKGILMQHAKGLTVIDISHDIQAFHTRQAAYILSAAFKNFAPGTCHIVLFDLFSEPKPRLALCQYQGHYFLAPDNGLLPLALGIENDHQAWQCFILNKEDTFADWLFAAAKTAQSLQSHTQEHLNLPPIQLKSTAQKITASFSGDSINCEVLHIDHYGNVVINLTRQQFESYGRGRPFRLSFMGMEEIEEINHTYQDVREGYKLSRFNSNDYLEICINRGQAASLFGLRLDGKHNNIKIAFE